MPTSVTDAVVSAGERERKDRVTCMWTPANKLANVTNLTAFLRLLCDNVTVNAEHSPFEQSHQIHKLPGKMHH